MHLLLFYHALPVFARGGGGGSGGGSGGGGGGILLIGYVPMHLLGAWLRKRLKKEGAVFAVLQVVGWVIAVIYAVLLTLVLRSIGFFAGIGAFLGMGAGLYGWFGKLKQTKQVKAALQSAAAQDGAWDPTQLTTYANQVFMRYQQDWTSFNTESMRTYMTPHYQYHAALMMHALQLAGRQDKVQSPVISQTLIVDMHDAANNDEDVVTIGFTAQANDVLIDTRDNKQLFTDNSQFTEFWQFERSGQTWLLDGIQQATASRWQHNASLEQFAAANGYYYSLDWGWLLLPQRGQLFNGGKFGTSDINNHVIGVYNQKLLVQLYTYLPKKQETNKSYLIAQTSLPKSYGDIVVRRKKGFHPFGIKGLREVSTEWPDFNKKYQVFATSPEQATSLELLNPRYMEQLADAPFEVNIEVVDNVVYLYAAEGTIVSPEHYQIILGLLQAAFKEMQL